MPAPLALMLHAAIMMMMRSIVNTTKVTKCTLLLDNLCYAALVSDQAQPAEASQPVFMPEFAQGAVLDRPQPRWGERAAQIRQTALRYPELSNRDIAKRVGCHPSNVDQVLSRFLGTGTVDQLRDFQGNQGDIFDALAHRTLASITDDVIDKAPLLARVTASAIMIDKARLVRGQPTSLHVTALMDVAAMMRERREAGELIRQSNDSIPPDGSEL